MRRWVALVTLLSLSLQVAAVPGIGVAMASDHEPVATMTEGSTDAQRPCHETLRAKIESAPSQTPDDRSVQQCMDLCALGVCCAGAPQEPAAQVLRWALPMVLGLRVLSPTVAVTDEPYRPPIATHH